MPPHSGVEDKDSMPVARTTEISATSPNSFEDAINEGISRATSTLRNVERVRVKDMNVLIENGNIVGYKVNLAITFVIEDEGASDEDIGGVQDPEEYRRLREAAEELEDLRAYDEALLELTTGEDELVPWRDARARIERERSELRRRGEL
jgi:dodecin